MATLPIVLLCALPASGKSEARKFLMNLTPEETASFRLGQTVQLDDYPYVEFMRKIDEELEKLSQPRIFFESADRGFIDGYNWGTLIECVNMDYHEMVSKIRIAPEHPFEWLAERLDVCRERCGRDRIVTTLSAETRAVLARELDATIMDHINIKNAEIPETLEGKTIVIEFARGGAHGSTFPLAAPFGYQYSLARLDTEILRQAAMLYIWVTPEQSRQKNIERGKPKADANLALSIFHGVPHHVMMNDYGTDDVEFLLTQSDRPDTIKVAHHQGEHFYVPVGRFDNREDLTTFCRADVAEWKSEEVQAIRSAMGEAFGRLLTQFQALH